MAKEAELDAELVSGLKAAKSKRVYFALVLKGSNDGALILAKTKVAPTAIADAKKKSGGSALLKGFCQYEDGKYIFETAKEAPATAAQAVKVIVKRDAAMAIHAEFRISTDPELLADDGSASAGAPPAASSSPQPDGARLKQPASPAPQPDGAELIKRLNALTPDIKTAMAGPNKAQVQALFVAVNGQIKSKAFPDAAKGLDELEKLLSQSASPAPQQDGAELVKRLNALTPDIKVAMAGPNKARVQALYTAITGQIKGKAFPDAAKGLDELEQLVKSGSAAAPQQNGSDLEASLADWTSTRDAAVAQLEKLAKAFETASHPQAKRGIELLKRIVDVSLTKRPATAQQVDELVRYVQTDENLLDAETPNPYGFTVKIRDPLLKALVELKKHVA